MTGEASPTRRQLTADLEVAVAELAEQARLIATLTIDAAVDAATLSAEQRYIKAIAEMTRQMDKWFDSLSGKVNDFMARGDARFDAMWKAIDADNEQIKEIVRRITEERELDRTALEFDIKQMHMQYLERIYRIEQAAFDRPISGADVSGSTGQPDNSNTDSTN
jgi:uncharacterized FlaG/YvyC family protein